MLALFFSAAFALMVGQSINSGNYGLAAGLFTFGLFILLHLLAIAAQPKIEYYQGSDHFHKLGDEDDKR